MALNPTVERYTIVAILALASIVFALLAYDHEVELDAARAIAREGVQTRAEVLGVSIGGRKSRSYYLSYRFDVGGRAFEAKRRHVTWEAYRDLEPGMSIPVRFHPSNPGIHVTAPEVERLAQWSRRIGWPFVSLLMGGLAFYLAWEGPITVRAKPLKKPRRKKPARRG